MSKNSNFQEEHLLLPNQYELLTQRIELLVEKKLSDAGSDLLARMTSYSVKFRNYKYARKILMDGCVDKDFKDLSKDLYPILQSFGITTAPMEDKDAAEKDMKAFYSMDLQRAYPDIDVLNDALVNSIRNRQDEIQAAFVDQQLPAKRNPLDLYNFFRFREIDSGDFATAIEAESEEHIICFKVFHHSSSNVLPTSRYLEREVNFLQQFKGVRGIVQYICHDADPSALYIGMEYIDGGSLADYKLDPATPAARFTGAMDIAVALDRVHKNGIIHTDVKRKNILIRSTGEFVLADFGLSVWINEAESDKAKVIGGKRYYMAPEIDKIGNSNIVLSPKADIYSFAVVMWEIMTSSLIQDESGVSAIEQTVSKGLPDDLRQYENILSIIPQCIQPDYTLRPTMSDIKTRLIQGLISEFRK